MEIFQSFQLLFELLAASWDRGGWLVFLFLGLYLLWSIFVLYNENRFVASVQWITLAIDVPKENEQTFLAVEQIFAQLHAVHVGPTFYEKHFLGEGVLWFSLEIVSFGGQVKYLAYLPRQFRDLFEASIYAQYPDAQIKEVEDYMKNVPQYNPDKSYFDIWGTQLLTKKEDAYPIRTYKFFEHQASQIIVDPLAGVLEALSDIKPYELMAVQYIFRPTDDKWKDHARKLIKKLKGEKEESKPAGALSDIGSSVMSGLTDIVAGAAGGGAAQPSPVQQEYEPPSKMMHLSPGEKDVIGAIEASIGKIGFETKIRLMYLAPKEKFRPEIKAGIVGAFRQFDDTNLNGLKPDTKKTWTTVKIKYIPWIEKPLNRYLGNNRKKRLLRYFKHRKFAFGERPFVLNIEEIATIFHFPLLTVKAPQLTKTEIKKGEAPINLPI